MIFLQRDDASLRYTFDWSADVPAGVTLSSAVHTVPSDLTLVTEDTDTLAQTSTIQMTGAHHGGIYLIKALALLSNGEQVPGEAILRVFNG